MFLYSQLPFEHIYFALHLRYCLVFIVKLCLQALILVVLLLKVLSLETHFASFAVLGHHGTLLIMCVLLSKSLFLAAPIARHLSKGADVDVLLQLIIGYFIRAPAAIKEALHYQGGKKAVKKRNRCLLKLALAIWAFGVLESLAYISDVVFLLHVAFTRKALGFIVFEPSIDTRLAEALETTVLAATHWFPDNV